MRRNKQKDKFGYIQYRLNKLQYMKELVKSLPLALFLILLCTLSISVYFGNLAINQNIKTVEGLDTTTTTPPQQSPTLNPTFIDDIKTILYFIKNLDNPSETTKPTETTKPNKDSSDSDSDDEEDPDDWFDHWNGVANDPSVLSSTDYVPKTRIIPNVCKKCSKHHRGVCTNCGGLGGNGTSSNYKNRFSDFIAAHGSGYKGQGNWSGFGGHDSNNPSLSHLVEDAGSGLVDVTKTALNNATGLVAGAGLGAIGLAEDAGSGTTGLLKDTASGATGLLRDTGSGAVGLVKDLGSGVKDILKSNPVQINQQSGSQNQQSGTGTANNPYQSGYYSQGTYNLPNNPLGINGIDPYSYNGALISKGSNYMPITDDFSAFRK